MSFKLWVFEDMIIYLNMVKPIILFEGQMKRIIISMVLFLNLLPYYNKETFSVNFSEGLMAQGYGAKGRSRIYCECNGVVYRISFDPGSNFKCPPCPGEESVSPDPCPFCGQYPCVCGIAHDPCDTSSEYYNECLCNGDTCFTDACDPTYYLYDECTCLGINCGGSDDEGGDESDCPCLLNLSSTPRGGIIRNNAGNILYMVNGPVSGRLGYPFDYNFTYGNGTAWLSDGSPISAIHVEGLTISGEETDFQNYSYNCLGWVLTGRQFVFYTNQTKEINGALGIPSVGEAISSGIIKMSETCEGIKPGQILLLFDETNHYIHTALYEGGGLYSTKNGMGSGEGVQYWTLPQIKALYYSYDSGAVKAGYINAPPRLINSSSLGKDSDGLITVNEFTSAASNCKCNPEP